VAWPAYSNWIDYELELVAVIGKRGKDISRERAADHIFGYTILNDLSAREAQLKAMATGAGKDIENLEICPARISKDYVNTLQSQALRQYLRSFQCAAPLLRANLAQRAAGDRVDVLIRDVVCCHDAHTIP
jgi:2-keto-4-pentenoate hydratase/2-oxohepta-3-ene-1,7-dioic acid hydratase in catechol pathway